MSQAVDPIAFRRRQRGFAGAEMLRGAAFTDVTAETVRTPLRFASAAECVQFERESFGALQQMLVSRPASELRAAWDEIEEKAREFDGDTGFETIGELIVGAGTK